MITITDGVKKGAILAPTALLPKALRVAAREHLLARLETRIARRAKLIIIAHPKSGNTWLKVMLTRLYATRHGINDKEFARYSELADRNPNIPRFAATNGWYSYEGAVGRLLMPDTENSALRNKPVILLARNPIDIAVSWYFQFTKRQSAHKQELINHFIEHPIDRHKIEMWEFVRQSDIGLPFLIEFLNTWWSRLEDHKLSLLVRYEDLRHDPAMQLQKITQLMSDCFSDNEIQAAVDFGSYDNLRKLESDGFFRQGGLTLRNSQDPESFKVRRAKVGGYRDYFTPEQATELEYLVNTRLSPVFGYTVQSRQANTAKTG